MKILADKIGELLKNKTVDAVWGYCEGTQPFMMTPTYVESAASAAKLTFNHFCYHNLANYLRDLPDQKTAVVLKRCDLAAVNILLSEGQLKRENLYLLAMDCSSLIDQDKLAQHVSLDQKENWMVKNGKIYIKDQSIELEKIVYNKCFSCSYQELDNYDELIPFPDGIKKAQPEDDWLTEYESKSATERNAEWAALFEGCIQCFACRQVCPMCYCRTCIADKSSPRFIPKTIGAKENMVWQITRIMHLVGRCTGCGECERACPMKIPLSRLTQKMRRVVKERYNFTPGLTDDAAMFWGSYDDDDPEDFIFHPEKK